MLLSAASNRRFCISSCGLLRQQLGLLGVQELLRLVQPRQRQSPEAVVGGQTQDEEAGGDIERADEDLARADGDMEMPFEVRRPNRLAGSASPATTCGLPWNISVVPALVGDPAGDDHAVGRAGGMEDVDRNLVEPVDAALLRELHLHVARAEHRLLLGALLQLKRADGGVGDRRREDGDAGRDDAQLPDEGPGGAGPSRQPRIDARNAAASLRPDIRHCPPQPCAKASANKKVCACANSPPSAHAG